MQLITRRVNEGLVLRGDIHVTVLDITKDHVRIGITSPSDTPSYWEQTLYLEESAEDAAEELQLQ